VSHIIGRGRYARATYPVQPGGFLSANVASTFVLRQGGSPAPGVYTTPDALRAALELVDPALYKVITFDSSIEDPHLTAGPWPMNNTMWLDDSTATSDFALHIDTGAVIDSTYLRIANGLQVSCEAVGTSPLVTSDYTQLVLDEQSELVSTPGSAPFLQVTAAGSFSKLYLYGESVVGDATDNVATVDVGQSLVAIITNGANLENHAVGGAGRLSSHLSPGALLGVQDTALGAQSILAISSLVNFTPAVNGNWPTGAGRPSLVSQALNILSAPSIATGFLPANSGAVTNLTVPTSSITKARGGNIAGYAFIGGTNSGATTITVQILRDATVIYTYPPIVQGAAGNWACSFPFLDALPNALAHTYSIKAAASGGATISVVGNAIVSGSNAFIGVQET
jgi:hypothetical protein